jgi:hypothetical protein
MPRDTSNRLVEYAKTQVSDSLRTVAVVYAESCEVVFIRKDLQQSYSAERYKEIVDSFRNEFGADAHATGESPVGEKHCLLHYHDSAFVFQFPHDACHSILLSVEPTVGSQLQTFIEGCEQRL